MANPEHLKILQQGVKAWNEWREQSPDILPDLCEASFARNNFPGANFQQANLFGSDLSWSNLDATNFQGAILTGTNMLRAILTAARLSGAELTRADIREVDLRGADVTGTNLHSADLRHSDLSQAEVVGVSLTDANLLGAIFRHTNLTGANLGGSVMGDNTLINIDLSVAIGLETVRHQGPSSVGIDTIYKSNGNIPEVFLRGCGVPEDFIVYAKALARNPIEFYSCFISYSSQDDTFAQRLHSDLQQKGVRCWFAPEDLKIGDKFRTRIDESIRIYDKLMVVLSEDSIRSPWVEEEVEAALEKERKQSKLVLFPIRLDDAVMETDQAWAASLRRVRHIGDFQAWKDHDQYQKSLERLLRDLKAESTQRP
ncbi:MAG TPA: toll/interleukin-1 receptor domain-containing protein [Terriglobia bacterium]|nr:toll/interleukin-1 receptor domain-containing protein [Terriglobia bacterium]